MFALSMGAWGTILVAYRSILIPQYKMVITGADIIVMTVDFVEITILTITCSVEAAFSYHICSCSS